MAGWILRRPSAGDAGGGARVVILASTRTTGTTCLVADERLRSPGRGYREVRQSYPRPGWVEHDPDEILRTVHEAAADALGRGIGAAASPGSGSRTSARRPSSGAATDARSTRRSCGGPADGGAAESSRPT
jgi:hypothetical protein